MSSSYYAVQPVPVPVPVPVPYLCRRRMVPIMQPRFIHPYPPPPILLRRPKTQRVTFYEDDIYVTVAKDSIHINQWIHCLYRRFYHPSQQALIGLDIEWLPNMEPGDDHPTAILQICAGNYCLIIQLLHVDRITNTLRGFLQDPRFLFVGVGVEDDVKKLQAHHRLCVTNYADINDLAKMALGEYNRRGIGLKRRAMEVLNKVMAKPLNVTLSKWDAEDLDENQIEYAAIDAFVSFKIAMRLMTGLKMKSR